MLACQCFGSESLPPMVLLHGFLGSSDDWKDLVRELDNDFYLVVIDLPGHGKSPALPKQDFFRFAGALEQTVTGLGLEQFVLMGYSLGGRLAMAYAKEFSCRLKALLLEGSHPGLPEKSEKEMRLAADQRWADRFKNEAVASVLKDWYQQAVFADLTDIQRHKLIEVRSSQTGASLADVMMAFSLGRQPDFRCSLRDTGCPVHYFYGERDSKFAGLGRSLKEQGCLTSLQCIAGSGHNIHREKPAELANSIRQLIRDSYGH